MKRLVLSLLSAVTLVHAEPWPGQTPLIAPQSDGVIVLNAEAAGFVMNDNLGQHVMNASDPKLKIVDGRIVNLREGMQLPAWRFRVEQAGKYTVFLTCDTADSEDCAMRVSFMEGKREFRVLASVDRKSAPVIRLGETSFGAGEFDAFLMLAGATNYKRLPRVQDVRLVPVSAIDTARIFERPEVRAFFAKDENVRDAERAVRSVLSELDRAKNNWNAKQDFAALTSYEQFMVWDRHNAAVASGPGRLTALNETLRLARLDALAAAGEEAFSGDVRVELDQWKAAQKQLAEQVSKGYPKTVFPVTKAPTGSTLFPVGNLDKFKVPEASDKVKLATFEAAAHPDAAARRAAFAGRNTKQGLVDLGRRLEAALRQDVPGLESFYAACKGGRYEEALDAYRDYFFLKLKAPEKYGATGLSFVDEFFQKNGKAGVLRAPFPDRVEKNLAGVAVYEESGTRVELRVGEPGSVDWAPATLKIPDGMVYGRGPDNNPFWKTPEGQGIHQQILFYRALNRLPTPAPSAALFPDLLLSYCFTGNKAHLGKFAEYLDDWSVNSVEDIDNCPANIRAATELQVIGWFRALLRIILDERPEFARDFPAPTLARFMMNITETYHPFVARAKRAELANWGIMGVEGALQDSLHFHEFRAMDYMNREMSRLARMNFIQHVSLDGEGLEAWDEGHMAIDDMLKTAPTLTRHGAPVFGDLETQAFADHVKTTHRALLTHLSPDGNYWVPWLSEDDSHRATIRGKIIDRDLIEWVFDDPEVRSRFFAILGKTPPKRELPLSDIQPYAQLAYLRDGFGKDSTSLLLQNFPVRSQTQGMSVNGKRGHIIGCMRTQYGVARDGKGVLEGSPILVDSKPPNLFTDLTPSGGKTDYSFQTPRNVQPGRFLASRQFDVVETMQDSPYRRHQFAYGRELLGLNSVTPDEPIRDVRATRRVFHLRNEGIFVVGDRVENVVAGREFAQMFVLPVRVPAPGEMDRLRLLAQKDAPLLEVDPAGKRVRSLAPGLPNVSLYVAGHDFTWGGRSTGEKTFEPVASLSAKSLYEKAKASKTPEKVLDENLLKIVSVRWRGEGNQALVSAVLARAAKADPAEVQAQELTEFKEMNGAGGIAGFSFKSPQGTEVWFQTAASGGAKLKAGPGGAQAGSLLVTRREGRLAGVVMDSKTVTLDGKTFTGSGDAFEFVLEKDGAFSATPVLAPIDTTVISPQQTVFADKVSVTFDIPTQKRDDIEFRYTMDGTDPGIGSTLFTGSVEITKDTLIKVRPFRKGLKETPWNIAGVDGGKTVSAVFRKTPPLPPVQAGVVKPGLRFSYFEDSWPRLMSHSGMYPLLPVKSSGEARQLLDPAQIASIRKTDRSYAVKYDGFIDVPESGVYRFFAPEPLYNTTKDAGYELRVWVDGREWFPNPDLHAENVWSVVLEKGLHRFEVSYVDFRWKTFRNEYWMSWNPKQMWEGTPVLELDGPSAQRQPVPGSWLRHE